MTANLNIGKTFAGIPLKDSHLYVAIRCNCRNWLTFHPGDINRIRECFLCSKKWMMTPEGDVICPECFDPNCTYKIKPTGNITKTALENKDAKN